MGVGRMMRPATQTEAVERLHDYILTDDVLEGYIRGATERILGRAQRIDEFDDTEWWHVWGLVTTSLMVKAAGKN